MSARSITQHLIEEGTAARAHYQIWWTLRNLAVSEFRTTMYRSEYMSFFLASSSGSYKLFFLALSKIFDRDDRVAGVKRLREALRGEGRDDLAIGVEQGLEPIGLSVEKIMIIRNKAIVHNEYEIPRARLYELNGITPNTIGLVIDTVCNVINDAAAELGILERIFDEPRMETSTFCVLQALKRERVGSRLGKRKLDK